MLDRLSGQTRLFFTVGNPVAQVPSPGGLTRAFEARGANAVQVAIHVTERTLDRFFAVVAESENVDGLVTTVPYKFLARGKCKTASQRSELIGAVNVVRRNADRSWHGDITDGLGFCAAAEAAGTDLSGRRALLIGAGGAGSAIGLALIDHGVCELAIYDLDHERQGALVDKLSSCQRAVVVAAATPNPSGFGLIANATPAGMRPGDALPVDVEKLTPEMHIGDVVTAPEVPPLVTEARTRGCPTHTGTEMFVHQIDLMADFLLGLDRA